MEKEQKALKRGGMRYEIRGTFAGRASYFVPDISSFSGNVRGKLNGVDTVVPSGLYR
jgi:hypothetical protein